MIWIDPVYFWYVLIPVLIISLGVQVYLKRTYAKWSKVRNSSDLTGIQVGKELFNRTSLQALPLEKTRGELTDHYDPGANVVRLSESTADKHSVSAMAVTAHELGHVQQYQTGSALIKARGFLLPALQFSPTISYLAILFGLIFNIVNLIYIGIIFFALMVIFSILTIPVEVNASRRGRRLLREAGFHPLEVIRSATLNGAEALGWDDKIGSVQIGKLADFVIIEENPLMNLK